MVDDEIKNSAAGFTGVTIFVVMAVAAIYGLWKAIGHFGISVGGLLTVIVGYPILVMSLGILPWILCTSLFSSAGWIEEDDNYVEIAKKILGRLGDRLHRGSDQEWDAVPVFNVIEYPSYLVSEEWAERRAIMLNRADYHCQLCNSRESLQVHHKTYKRIGRERISDLLVLCSDCHAVQHGRVSTTSDK